jgi:hypothetical protein
VHTRDRLINPSRRCLTLGHAWTVNVHTLPVHTTASMHVRASMRGTTEGAPEFVTLPRSTIEICPAPPVPVSENHAPMLHSSFSPVHMHELAGPTEPSHAAAGGIESIESGAGSAFVHVPAVRATGRQRRESSSNDAPRPSNARRVQPLRTLSGSTCRVILAILAALQLI